MFFKKFNAQVEGIFKIIRRIFHLGYGFSYIQILILVILNFVPIDWEPSNSFFRIRIKHNGKLICLYYRLSSSDAEIFWEIFVMNTYNLLGFLKDAKLVVDLGANIGFASAYFSACYPDAKIIAVEPLPENLKLLRKTAGNLMNHVTIIPGAIQNKPGKIIFYWSKWWASGTTIEQIARKRQGDKRRAEHRTAQAPCFVEAVTMSEILALNDTEYIDILKMDIEGAEAGLIKGSSEWLQKVRILIGEIHDKYINGKTVRKQLKKAGLVPIIQKRGRTEIFINKKLIKTKGNSDGCRW
ncbi:MAG: FkbM family methyltransferase [bacterium]